MSTALVKQLIGAVTPCDKYSCIRRPDCAAFKLACDSWIFYVRTGFPHPPTAIILEGANKRRGAEVERNVTPMPTRASFEFA